VANTIILCPLTSVSGFNFSTKPFAPSHMNGNEFGGFDTNDIRNGIVKMSNIGNR